MSIYDNRYLVQYGPHLDGDPDMPRSRNHYFSSFHELLWWLDKGYEVGEGGPCTYCDGWCGRIVHKKLDRPL